MQLIQAQVQTSSRKAWVVAVLYFALYLYPPKRKICAAQASFTLFPSPAGACRRL